MNEQVSEALNDCLERLVRGETVSQCLSSYPQHAAELQPLLEVALVTIRVADTVQPTPEAKGRNFERFAQAVAERSASPPRRQPGLVMRWLPVARPIAISLAAIALFVTSAGVATAASSNSVPGELLYWVKTTKESIESSMPMSDESRANHEANLANVRGDEIRMLVERRNFPSANQAVMRMNNHLMRSARYAGVRISFNPVEMPFNTPASIGQTNAAKLKDRLERDRVAFKSKVEQVIILLPPEERVQARYFIQKTELGYRLIIEAMQPGRPGTRPFIAIPVRGRSGR